MESCHEFIGSTSLRRDVQHRCRYLFPLSRRSHRATLSERGKISKQNGSQFAWHPSQLRDERPCLLEKIPLRQLRAEFRSSESLESSPRELCQCYRVPISGRIPQNVTIHFRLSGRVRHRGPRGKSSLPLVYRVWLWSDPRSHHRRATYLSFEMVAKTRTHLSQCGFQCPRIRRSQVLRECRSQSTDREHDDIHGFHRGLSLRQCRIAMDVCNRRPGRSDRKIRAKVGKRTQEKKKKKRIN